MLYILFEVENNLTLKLKFFKINFMNRQKHIISYIILNAATLLLLKEQEVGLIKTLIILLFFQLTNSGDEVICECTNGVSVVEISTGKVIDRLDCEDEQVTNIALSPDNTSLIIALQSSNVRHYQWSGKY